MTYHLASLALVFFTTMARANAFSFESLMDPLMSDDGELNLEKLSEIGRVVDDVAARYFNLTFGTTSTLTYPNAILLIFVVSAAIFGVFALLFMATYSIATGMANENDGVLLSDTADQAARLFFSFINSTTTISASYALVIILGISFALFVLLGLAYLLASAAFVGTTIPATFGKRSLPDGDDPGLSYNWARILQILDEMEEHFRRLGAVEKHREDCRKRIICQLSSNVNSLPDKDEKSTKKIASLTKELSAIYEKKTIRNEKESDEEAGAAREKVESYYRASEQGRKEGKQCAILYPRCS